MSTLEQIAEPIGNGNFAHALSELNRRGIKLPAEYEAHLKTHPALGMSAVVRQQTREFRLNRLFGGTGVNGIIENFDNASPRRSYVAIGCDHLGNQFLLAHKGKQLGSVWFWDHESDKLWPVARSFKVFLQLLCKVEQDEEIGTKPPQDAPTPPKLLAVRVPVEEAASVRPVLEGVLAQARSEGLGRLLGESDEPGTWLWIVRVLADRDGLVERIRAALGTANFQIADWVPRSKT